jgi:NADH-quinone oxidoreductase subunit E
MATFYTMYNLKPVGKFMFEFCQTSPCCLNGVEDLMDYTCENWGKIGKPLMMDFEVRGVECLGACVMSYDAAW